MLTCACVCGEKESDTDKQVMRQRHPEREYVQRETGKYRQANRLTNGQSSEEEKTNKKKIACSNNN